MSLKQEYFRYLEHFRETVSLGDFHAQPWVENLVGLRHDVDHDLEMALEMSFWEKEMGFRATYFLLPTAEYWNQEKLLDKALQLQDFGHEVGLHLNVITEWLQDKVDDPLKRIKEVLGFLRRAGLKVHGVSAHGDMVCYENNFINYWVFSELRPEDPVSGETGLNAEGIPAVEDDAWITYPESHALRRQDGCELPLWSVPMEKLGLAYEAVHLSYDRYFSDSHGRWKRSPDPLDQDLTKGRHHILIHPEHWRGPQKIYFFLSTARSGSKWLANILEKATPLTARHEFTLNHSYHKGQWRAQHLTGPGFTDLARDREKARRLILDSRIWIEEQEKDFVEANIYLERFLPLTEEIFPDAVLVHLHRNPADVVRSIINRDWYDTPEDDRHPVMEVPGWIRMSQFEKACWYVRITNENLLRLRISLCFENMVSQVSYFENFLKSLNIPFYPRLAGDEYTSKINASRIEEFPQYAGWPEILKEVFRGICGALNLRLGYGPEGFRDRPSAERDRRFNHYAVLTRPTQDTQSRTLLDISLKDKGIFSSLSHSGCRLKSTKEGLELTPKKGRHSFLLVGGGEWKTVGGNAGWEPKIGHYYKGTIKIRVYGGGNARLFCLMYDQGGALMAKKLLKKVMEGDDQSDFTFRVRSNASRFNLAVHLHKDDLPAKVMMESFYLHLCSLVPDLSFEDSR